MLADNRSQALMENFASEWLGLRKLRSTTPDQKLFPDFNENLRQAMRQETELFIKSQMRADEGVADLLTANYTFVNQQLAQYYRIPNIYGAIFGA